MSAPLNLARRPFRNERLPTLILVVSLVLLAALSVRHAIVARDLRPGGAGDIEGQVVALETETARLHREAADLGTVSAPSGAIEEWAVLRELVDRRAFSWTGLFAALEQALPPGIRLVSVSPGTKSGQMTLTLVAVGRGVDDALALPKALAAQGEFQDPFLQSYSESQNGVDITCSVRYLGRNRPREGSR